MFATEQFCYRLRTILFRSRAAAELSLNSHPFSHYRPGDLGLVPAAGKTANADKLRLNGVKNAQCGKVINLLF